FTLESFQEFVRSGKVGHFLLGAAPPGAPPTQARQPVIQWVQRTWQDVSAQAGLPPGTLYRFTEQAQFSGGWQRVTPGSGAGQPPTGQGAADGPWRHRVVSASSADGLAWKADGVVLADQASVPDAVVDREGRIRVYYVDWRNQGITVAIARADGEYDYYQVALAGQPFKQMVDPDVVLLPDGRYRMFYVASTPGVPGSSNRIESAISDDGVVFTQEPGVRLEGLGLTDPDVILVGDVWYAYVSLGPRNLVYISRDGSTFTFLDYLPLLGSVSGTIPVEGGYRMYYHASAGGPGGSLSVHSAFLPAGGAAWQYEGLRLAPTAGSLDALGVADPAPIRLSDGTFKMFYKTFIP
ncbi:MAG: hypothetical protein HYX97_01900, partial [Chloroflexi bacterium]|nr:hypothetical protein [Chloroflexota bacterium]